jgi:hypothetical protein
MDGATLQCNVFCGRAVAARRISLWRHHAGSGLTPPNVNIYKTAGAAMMASSAASGERNAQPFVDECHIANTTWSTTRQLLRIPRLLMPTPAATGTTKHALLRQGKREYHSGQTPHTVTVEATKFRHK